MHEKPKKNISGYQRQLVSFRLNSEKFNPYNNEKDTRDEAQEIPHLKICSIFGFNVYFEKKQEWKMQENQNVPTDGRKRQMGSKVS